MTHFFDEGLGSLPDEATEGREREVYDALADLFLGDEPALRLADDDDAEEASAPAAPAVSGPARVDALVLGHLPVLAGAWATQHARSLAEEEGRPVALVRLSAGHATVQVMGDRAALDGLGEHEDFETAIGSLEGRVGRWLVRVDAPFELELASHEGVDGVCLLSGVDDAAVVAAYRTLKGLSETIPGDEETAEISVRFMGASEEEANEAEAKVDRVSRAFLRREVRFLPAATRIDAGSGVTVYRGDDELECREAMRQTLEGIARQRGVAPAAEPATDPVAATDGAGKPAPDESAVIAKSRGLAERLGLTTLGVPCPVAPEVELAHDENGRLHLLGLGAGSAGDLLAAEGWAEANLAVIASAGGFEQAPEIVVRVLTETPSRDRRLLDGRFRVDLLREVRVGGESAWCCVPLNRECN